MDPRKALRVHQIDSGETTCSLSLRPLLVYVKDFLNEDKRLLGDAQKDEDLGLVIM